MSDQHSPEPWTLIIDEDRRRVVLEASDGASIEVDSLWSDTMFAEHCDNFKRIVACVNFCRDIPTEWMQGKIAKTVQVSPNERPEDGWQCLAQIPNLLGLIPVCKEPPHP